MVRCGLPPHESISNYFRDENAYEGAMMDYSFRVHVIKNTASINGHVFIEIKSPDGSKYYELNTNPTFSAPTLVDRYMKITNDNGVFIPSRDDLWDGKITKTTDLD